ncbi:MAG: hypothetical protein IKL15_00865 [Mycoplasmataceae bacterium]|nr:hypothetical protein [Mycoplasmataceae bacterium]
MDNKVDIIVIVSLDNINFIATYNQDKENFIIHEEKINLANNWIDENIGKEKIKNILENIQRKVGFKVKKINIILDDFMNFNKFEFNEVIIKETISYYNTETILNSNDCHKIVNSMTKKLEEKNVDQQLISIVPFKFIYLENGSKNEKESSVFPINKKLEKIEIMFSIRYMNKNKYQKLINFFKLLNLEVNKFMLESQISIYENLSHIKSNKINFVLCFKNDKTILASTVNDIVIKIDTLKYSFKNLIEKISKDFSISIQEAKDLIFCYGKVWNNSENDLDIVYSSNNIFDSNSKYIRRIDISKTIKSFLKTISKEANEIIISKIKNNFTLKPELKFVGDLLRINGVEDYCSKYFQKINISSINNNFYTINSWNKNFISINNYLTYNQIVDSKINSNDFYYHNIEANNANLNNKNYKIKQKNFNKQQKEILKYYA